MHDQIGGGREIFVLKREIILIPEGSMQIVILATS